MNHLGGQIAVDSSDVHPIRRQFILQNLKDSIEDDLTFIVAWIFAIVLLGISLSHGFSTKSIFGNSGMLISTNVAKNIFDFVYLVTAIGTVTVTLFGEKEIVKFMQAIGKIYLLAAFIGFMKFGSLNDSEWVSIINFVFGAALVTAGSVLQDYRQNLLVARLIAKQRHPGICSIMDTIKKSTLRYGIQKRQSNVTKRICCHEGFSELSCIKGELN